MIGYDADKVLILYPLCLDLHQQIRKERNLREDGYGRSKEMLTTWLIVNFWVLEFLEEKCVQSENYNINENER
jgi:hypothetical protein